ncbi:hypothetical protein A2572_04060 [Candidatus Collierbacteria bacterium RIFOXYD1_FULL_40_9]|uniref:tRNA-binding domain-containing protein n=1 Tax=Candidatus Collierbacteria bacterium RIFOXYD1_FULL_40_9 TaxID=1817731 RepID=A0A1F5FWY7_9BACT|nr:MAG: hypothetical protein A2572_04060 [Candidatus Collierbacteria bacterium RIFOXYD1_FULL_40_9]
MKDLINYEDFVKLEIRAGLIMEALAPEWSEKLIKYVIDFGEEVGKRTLFSGIRAWYKPEELVGKKVPVILNMTPKKMGKEYSEGMVLMVDGKEKPVMIFLDDEVEIGSVVR